jgi:hypothetical protein
MNEDRDKELCGDVFDERLPEVKCERKPKHADRHMQRNAMSGRVNLSWWTHRKEASR